MEEQQANINRERKNSDFVIRFGDEDDIIDIRMDNVFKAVFTKDTPASRGALSRLLSALIGRELTVLAISANEPPVDNIRDRQIRFDIACKAETGELVNVEMSLNPDAFEPVRLEFYAGKLFTGQDIRGVGKTYGDLEEAWQIAILAKERFFPDDDFFHRFEYYDPDRQVSLQGRSRIVTLELAKVEAAGGQPVDTMTTAEQWAYFFQYLTDKRRRRMINELVAQEEGIAMASEVLISISRDEVERARLASEYKHELDTQSRLVQAERNGQKKGLEKGLEKGRQEIARKMKASNVPASQISVYTGLSEQQIADL
jgi:predicted transposase/invertase (TIGR01784 family)